MHNSCVNYKSRLNLMEEKNQRQQVDKMYTVTNVLWHYIESYKVCFVHSEIKTADFYHFGSIAPDIRCEPLVGETHFSSNFKFVIILKISWTCKSRGPQPDASLSRKCCYFTFSAAGTHSVRSVYLQYSSPEVLLEI